MATIKLGELLVKAKVITETQLKAALAEQRKWGGRLGETLVRMEIMTEELLVKALAKQLNIPPVNLEAVPSIPPHVKAKISLELANEQCAVPLKLPDDKTLVVALAEPQDLRVLDTLRAVTRCRIVPNVAGRSAIQHAIIRFYGQDTDLAAPDEPIRLMDAQGQASGSFSLSEPPAEKVSAPSPGPRSGDPSEVLRSVEQTQRKEVAALKAMIELLIEKGVFTRDEYLSKVRR